MIFGDSQGKGLSGNIFIVKSPMLTFDAAYQLAKLKSGQILRFSVTYKRLSQRNRANTCILHHTLISV